MWKKMKIGPRVIIVSFLLVMVSVICTAVTTEKSFEKYMLSDITGQAESSIIGFKALADEAMAKTRLFRDQLAGMEELAEFVYRRDKEGIYKLTKPLMDASEIKILIVAASDGEVLARPHDKDRIGDSIASDDDFKKAIEGVKYQLFRSGSSSKLGYYCGAPVIYDGRIVGMLRAAFSLEDESLVDQVKNLFGVEATVFAGKTRINTTFTKNGNRALETDAAQAIADIVLNDAKDYSGEIEIFGGRYMSHYSPVKDPDSGAVVGMYFTGKSMENMYAAIRSAVVTTTLAAAVVLAIAFIIAWRTARGISKPLNRITEMAERGEEGDLTITRDDFEYNGGDELAALVDSLSGMISSQGAALSRAVDTSDAVAEHAKKLARLSEENNNAASQTKSLIEEVSRLCQANSEAAERGSVGVGEMAHGADSVAQMSADSADSLAKTTKISHEAASSVANLARSISIVDEKTIENQTKIRELSTSVSEISNFMNVITSIADQTNLLALNAAIEAARAGDTGRGFAVVAEEVRKLAEESRNASKSVEHLVTTLIKNAKEAISATEASVEIVKNIKSMAQLTTEELNQAIKEITSANEAIQSIAAVAQEQTATGSAITHAIDELNKSTDTISTKMEELHELSDQTASSGNYVSLSAEEMSLSAEEMRKVLAQFKMNSAERLALH
ncbi:MAG: methyl-accepting chemotaxis protein [Synergistaceae bacterium]|jgi:methyl-accepting chemotaxis protein|nr:methyl-accepting chemotaxis protein [Synergistaceae bacterium]